MNRLLFTIMGIFLASFGLTFIILDLNLLVINYTVLEFLIYIFTHLSTLLFIVGLFIIYLSIKT